LGGKHVKVVSSADDNGRMIIWAGSDVDPGIYYLYDAQKVTLDVFSNPLPGLDPEQLARSEPVHYTARDGTEINGYLTLPRGREAHGLPLIIMPHGGPYGVRDKLAFDTDAQFLASRGYAVLQPNYRGSGGYGESFERLGDGQIGRKMQDDLDDAMDWLVQRGVADPARVCMIGSSYGGYAALWAVIRNPERYRCAASFAGVTDWKKQISYDADSLTSKRTKKLRETVAGTDDSFNLDMVSPLKQIDRLNRPVLLGHGEDDTTVPFDQFTRFRDAAARAHRPLDLVTFPDEGHGFYKHEDRQQWYEALEAFLARNNPAD
jgi:dipeptidyl aminopeptidase/acylaminoacyl peptidase